VIGERHRWLGLLVVAVACGSASEDGRPTGTDATTSETTSTGTSSTTDDSTGTDATSTSTTCTDAVCGSSSSTGDVVGTGSTGAGTTGEVVCNKNVVLTGYWPPSNEMLRAFSTNAAQNPDGWQGENWRGLGYDVYAFFPEFPPDGDPTNDPLGDEGSVGSPTSDMRVDYQDTSEDFWRIMDEYAPLIVITTSRGGSIDWELEALEGGHDGGNPGDPSADWSSDGYGVEILPVENSVEARTWSAISQYRQGTTIPSALPLDEIFAATDGLTTATVQIDTTGTSGNYLSGFAALHGLVYEETTTHSVAAGHIHVGTGLGVDTARTLIEATLEAVLMEYPADQTGCSPQMR
jgi:hypothetical protein